VNLDSKLTQEEEETLIILRKRNSGIISIEEIGKLTGLSKNVVVSVLDSLEKKGLIRYAKIAGETSQQSSELSILLLKALESILNVLNQLEILERKKTTTRNSIFLRLKDELNQKLNDQLSLFKATKKRIDEEINALNAKIDQLSEKIEEVGLRLELNEIKSEDAEKLTENLRAELKTVKEIRDAFISTVFGEKGDELKQIRKIREERLRELKTELEICNAKYLIGEISEKEFEDRKVILTEKIKKLESTTDTNEIQNMIRQVVNSMSTLFERGMLSQTLRSEIIKEMKSFSRSTKSKEIFKKKRVHMPFGDSQDRREERLKEDSQS
jgi:DNA-binding IscR family transcriptional regulator